MIASWRSTAAFITSGWASQRFVLPSMSVYRNVTVPVGKVCADRAKESVTGSLLLLRNGYKHGNYITGRVRRQRASEGQGSGAIAHRRLMAFGTGSLCTVM